MDWDRPNSHPARVTFKTGWAPRNTRSPGTRSAVDVVQAFFQRAGEVWGMTSPENELRVTRIVSDQNGYRTVKLGQRYNGVDVHGTGLQVGVNASNEIRLVQGAFEPVLEIKVTPSLSSSAALKAALNGKISARAIRKASLYVLPRSFFQPTAPRPRLAWRVVIQWRPPKLSRTLYIDAHDGTLIREVPANLGLYREVYKPSGNVEMGKLLMNEAGPVGGYTPDNDALAAYKATQLYDAYLVKHGISSFTNKNDWYKAVIHSVKAASSTFGGAYFHWDDVDKTKAYAAFASTGVVYPGPALDIVSHEWTHGLLFYTADLESTQYESRTLHEAFSDAVACMVDANDWAIGDASAKRRLNNPGLISGHHDHYSEFKAADGWYKNSTIFSHALFLMGDTNYNVHPDSLLGVQGIGRPKAGAIIMRAIKHYLFPAADFMAARWAVITSCEDLIGGSSGIVSSDCGSVRGAFQAVGIPHYKASTVAVKPKAGNIAGCIDQGGHSFPPKTKVTPVFEDVTDMVQARHNTVTTKNDGTYTWNFGLACTGPDATAAKARANEFLDRVDPKRVGFSARPMRYWAEHWDGGIKTSNIFNYTLSYSGSCTPKCSGKSCGADGCGGTCGTCTGTMMCAAGTCTAPSGSSISVCGTLNGSVNWTKANNPVKVTCDVKISGNLTIGPGVVVAFNSAEHDLIINAGGSLTAVGSANAPIVFTSASSKSAGSWGGIGIPSNAGTVKISHAEFRYGGYNSSYYGAHVFFPVRVDPRTKPTLDNLVFLNNRRNGVGVVGGTYTSNTYLNNPKIPYILDGDLKVSAGTTLTVAPGVVVRFEGNGTDLVVDGRLIVNGTNAKPVFFTSLRDDAHGGDAGNDGSTAPSASNWGGIYLNHDATQLPSLLTGATILYGGYDSSYYGGHVHYPLRVTGLTQPTIVNVSLKNNRRNGIGLDNGKYSKDLRLNVTGLPYILAGDLTVNAGVTMTVDPGVIVRFENVSTDLLVNGRLLVNGTSTKRVYFTSLRDDAHGGDAGNDGTTSPSASNWGGVYLGKQSSLGPSTLSNLQIMYGGYDSSYYGGQVHYPIRVNGSTLPKLSSVVLKNNRRNAVGFDTGTYSQNLKLNIVGIPYVFHSDLVVNAGVTMTVDPGVIVRFENASTDIRVHGRLLVNGTSGEPVYFTSLRDDAHGGDAGNDGITSPGPSSWGGIYLGYSSTQNPSSLSNLNILYGGYDSSYYGAQVYYPIRVSGRTQPTLTNVTLKNNRRNAVGIDTGTYSSNLRLNITGLPYVVDSDVTVNKGVAMTVDAGVIVRFERTSTDLRVYGRLLANGTLSKPIYFTSLSDDAHGGDAGNNGTTSPGASDWGGVYLGHDSTQNASALSHLNIMYGGYDSSYYGGQVHYPLRVSGLTQPTVKSVKLTNNRRNGVGLDTGGYSSNLKLNIVGLPYVLDGDLTVNAGVTMTVAPGVIVKFDGSSRDLLVNGKLLASGAGNTIQFTSVADDAAGGDTNNNGASVCKPGQWGGIVFGSSSSGSVISSARIGCGGAGGSGSECGLYVNGGSAAGEGILFDKNDDAVCLVNNGRLDLGGGAQKSKGGNRFVGPIPGNNNWAVHNDSSYDVYAYNNWWGYTTTTQIEGVIRDKLDNSASGRVRYNNFQNCLAGASCNDGNSCTYGDKCVAGQCKGTAYTCKPTAACQLSSGATCNGDGTCSFKLASGGTICRASKGPCDPAETCTGSSKACPTDTLRTSGFVCRTKNGDCDVAEKCTGSSAACPADAAASSGTTCRAKAGPCDVAEACNGIGKACPKNFYSSGGTVCRAKAGNCDVAEKCTGSSATCPTDAVASSSATCRAAVGPCDLAETCDGANKACPTNTLRSSGTVCRAKVGACDVAEKCTGSAASCPLDAAATSGATCRTKAGDCDVAETCDGTNNTCPADTLQSGGTVCRAQNGACDVVEKCTGSSASCPVDVAASSGVICRAAAGLCDVAENCDGFNKTCPKNFYQAGGSVCRAQKGGCDKAEICSGSAAACPTDSVSTSGTTCRPTAGPCDAAETCDGTNKTCPTDLLQASGTVCRAKNGGCDVAEICSGAATSCPVDGYALSTAVCRPSSGDCDLAEACSGKSNLCPFNLYLPNGTQCMTGSGSCLGGKCVLNPDGGVVDGGQDGAVDGGGDGAADAGADSGADAQGDGAPDASGDQGVDAAADSAGDAVSDASKEAGEDAKEAAVADGNKAADDGKAEAGTDLGPDGKTASDGAKVSDGPVGDLAVPLEEERTGCICNTGSASGAWSIALPLVLLVLLRRRRRQY